MYEYVQHTRWHGNALYVPLLLGAINVDRGVLVALVEILNNAVAEAGGDFGDIG